MELLHADKTGAIRQTAFEVHCFFGSGFMEKVYENALKDRLCKKGFKVEQQKSIEVRDQDGSVVGEYLADLLVDDLIVVEIKAASKLAPENTAQLLNYLKATGLEVGVLINFGTSKLEFRRFVRGQKNDGPDHI
ncbi:MAG: GxxExxY protein [Planctomycetes bacterium]|nr:GxxExxY protein [Planctomycetota bacterium]